MKIKDWHRFYGRLEKSLALGNSQFFLHGKKFREDLFFSHGIHNQTFAYTLAYGLLGHLKAVDYVILLGSRTFRVYSLALGGNEKLDCQKFDEFESGDQVYQELTRILSGTVGSVRGDADSFFDEPLGGEEISDESASQLNAIEERSSGNQLLGRLQLITDLMGRDGVKKFAIVLDGFEWMANLFPSQSHNVGVIEEVQSWQTLARTEHLSFITIPDLTVLGEYLQLDEKDTNCLYVGSPGVEELVIGLRGVARRHKARVVKFSNTDLKTIATALKSKGLNLKESKSYLERFLDRHADMKVPDKDIATQFKKELETQIDDVDWDTGVILKQDVKQNIKTIFDRFIAGDDPELPKGILLTGPPGTGKTHIAKALANIGGCYFMPLKLADFKGEYVGTSGQNVRRVFQEARAASPTLMFIDEIDTIFSKRGGGQQDSFASDIINQFLAETDGVDTSRQKIFIVATTNRADLVDDAITSRLRPMEIPLPDGSGRKAILQNILGKNIEHVESLDDLAVQTDGLSGRDLKALCNGITTAIQAGHTDPVQQAIAGLRAELAKQLRGTGLPLILAHELEPPVIQGYKALKHELITKAETLQQQFHAMRELNIPPTNGVLLYGPPGNGKTLMSKYLAGERGMDFIPVSSQYLAGGVGVDKTRLINQVFDNAIRISVTNPAGVLLFIDEFDSLACADMITPDERSALLTGITQIRQYPGILLMAATNKRDELDSAIIRSGRFDQHIYMPSPDAQEIQEILSGFCNDTHFSLEEDQEPLMSLAMLLSDAGRSISDLEAAVVKVKQDKVCSLGLKKHYQIKVEDLEQAVRDMGHV